MPALIIILSVLALLGILLLLPVSLHISFKDDLFLKVKLSGIRVYEIKPQEDIEKPSPAEASDKSAETDVKGAFKTLTEKLGFRDAVKEILTFIKALTVRLKKQLKHILIRRLILNVRVASPDAAKTAIEYGLLCSAIYPALSFIDTTLNAEYKKINVFTDFEQDKPDFDFSVIIRVKILFLIKMAFAAFSEYKNFRMRNEL